MLPTNTTMGLSKTNLIKLLMRNFVEVMCLLLNGRLPLKFINQLAKAENICISLTRLVAPNYARKDFSLNLVLPVPEFSFSRPIPLGNFLARRLNDCDDSIAVQIYYNHIPERKEEVSMETRFRRGPPFCPRLRSQRKRHKFISASSRAQRRSLPKLSTQLRIAWSLIYLSTLFT